MKKFKIKFKFQKLPKYYRMINSKFRPKVTFFENKTKKTFVEFRNFLNLKLKNFKRGLEYLLTFLSIAFTVLKNVCNPIYV